MFFNSLIISVQIGSSNISRWILPYEIVLVIYFVLIIYFITNTGELVKYMKTILFNIVVFIELFFVQKNIDKVLKKESQEEFFSGLWIYLLFLVIFICYGIMLFSKSIGRYLLDRINKLPRTEKKTKEQKMYGILLLDAFNISSLLGINITLLRTDDFDLTKITILAVFMLLCVIMTVASRLLNSTKKLLSSAVHEIVMNEIEKDEKSSEKVEEKVETTSVPYYLVN